MWRYRKCCTFSKFQRSQVTYLIFHLLRAWSKTERLNSNFSQLVLQKNETKHFCTSKYLKTYARLQCYSERRNFLYSKYPNFDCHVAEKQLSCWFLKTFNVPAILTLEWLFVHNYENCTASALQYEELNFRWLWKHFLRIGNSFICHRYIRFLSLLAMKRSLISVLTIFASGMRIS